ncbi:MAG: hypothetical protein FJX25_19425, partial [Alphaproteobacteria bacterium]|nr:hypothetical protein [Alphaproteobacteria bacterium]
MKGGDMEGVWWGEDRNLDAVDVQRLYRLFLHRDPESSQAVLQLIGRSRNEVIRSSFESPEFIEGTLLPLAAGLNPWRKNPDHLDQTTIDWLI